MRLPFVCFSKSTHNGIRVFRFSSVHSFIHSVHECSMQFDGLCMRLGGTPIQPWSVPTCASVSVPSEWRTRAWCAPRCRGSRHRWPRRTPRGSGERRAGSRRRSWRRVTARSGQMTRRRGSRPPAQDPSDIDLWGTEGIRSDTDLWSVGVREDRVIHRPVG